MSCCRHDGQVDRTARTGGGCVVCSMGYVMHESGKTPFSFKKPPSVLSMPLVDALPMEGGGAVGARCVLCTMRSVGKYGVVAEGTWRERGNGCLLGRPAFASPLRAACRFGRQHSLGSHMPVCQLIIRSLCSPLTLSLLFQPFLLRRPSALLEAIGETPCHPPTLCSVLG